MTPPDITIREIRPTDLEALRAIGKRALPFPLNLLMMATVARSGLVALEGERIVGAMTLRHTDIAGRRWGILDWAVVEPDRQGRGIGRALGEQALPWLEARGCQEVITTDVDGYNSPSWHTAYAQGLRYWPASAQLRALGLHWPRLMLTIPHVGVGSFILHRSLSGGPTAPDAAARPGIGGWLGALFWAIVIVTVGRVRTLMWAESSAAGILEPLDVRALLLSALVIAAYLALRSAAHAVAARRERLPLAFRFWISGTGIALLLSAAFGAMLPAFTGSFYAREPNYDYLRNRAPLGRIMLAGILASMGLLLASQLTLYGGAASLHDVAQVGRGVGIVLAITDLLSVFPPLDVLPAGRVWRWKRGVWLLVALGYALLLIGVPLLF